MNQGPFVVISDHFTCLSSAGHVWNRRRGVPESALCAQQQWSGQRHQHDPDRRRNRSAEEERRHSVGHPKRPEGPVDQPQDATHSFTFHTPLSIFTHTLSLSLSLSNSVSSGPFFLLSFACFDVFFSWWLM